MSASGQPVPGFVYALPVLFPVFFAGLWLAVGLLLGVISRWFDLQRRFPDTGETALVTEHWCSAQLNGVRMNNVLTLAACPSGLRMRISRLFGPFQKPVLVPWREIGVEQTTLFFVPVVRLALGQPAVATMYLRVPLWQRLAAATPNAPAGGDPAGATPRTGFGLYLQWAATTLFAGIFFTLAPRLMGASNPPPLAIAFGFPAVAFGLGIGLQALIRR